MKLVSSVNDLVRRKLRYARHARKLGLREAAVRAGIPVSSYASMESGAYRINLDALFRILGVLGVDIADVWPVESASSDTVCKDLLYLRRIQEFRLNEVIGLASASGGAFFTVSSGKCQILMHQNLADSLLDRLVLYLECRELYKSGFWWRRTEGKHTFYLYLRADGCPDFVERLIAHYMINWSAFFAQELRRQGSCNSEGQS